jgi:2-polyprenyl-3-methyl-5-hydroxy-6-metoxy-1,4-benzoquinol methylase
MASIEQQEQPATTAEERFAFGKNRANFASWMSVPRVEAASASLREKLEDLTGKSFLDIGSGSGLHSLAAVRLGATRVHSFDYDRDSIVTAQTLRMSFASNADWNVEQGSAPNEEYIRSLGDFDVVYSWSVLHHTGDMWKALELAAIPTKAGGRLFVSIYNDQGKRSDRWKRMREMYVNGNVVARRLLEWFAWCVGWAMKFLRDVIKLRPMHTWNIYRSYHEQRGMSSWHDVVEWAGGYPFEAAKPEEIFDFFRVRGFVLERMNAWGGGLGCNEVVFRRER